MKKQYILPILTISAMAGLALTNVTKFDIKNRAFIAGHKNAAGAPAARTGAPGEQNCTVCHAGTAQNGDAINSLTIVDGSGNEVTSYLPDSTYTMKFFIDNPATKKGFQLVGLDVNTNTQAGTMTALTGTNIVTSGGRQYVNHKSTSNTTTTGWDFKWKAPSSNVGNIRFYAAANVTNNSGTDGGDVIYLSQFNIARNPLASVEKQSETMSFTAFFASSTNTINLNFDSKTAGNGFVNLVDLSGKSIYSNNFGNVKIGSNKEKVLLPAEIRDGIYIVHLFVNNQSTTHKMLIQR